MALAQSLNIPAVKVLEALGPGQAVRPPRSRSASTPVLPKGAEPSLAIALGRPRAQACRISPTLYAGLARGGEPIALKHRRDERRRASRAAPASGCCRRSRPGTSPTSCAMRRRRPTPSRAQIAYKTGTSYGFRDAWAVGYDGRHTIAVWVGRPDGAATPGLAGRTAAAPLLFDAFARLRRAARRCRRRRAGALVVAGSDLPPPLKRFREATRTTAHRAYPRAAVQIAFPPDRSELEVEDGDGAAIVVKAEGGALPLTWLVDGVPIESDPARREAELPASASVSTISVIDAKGRARSSDDTLEIACWPRPPNIGRIRQRRECIEHGSRGSFRWLGAAVAVAARPCSLLACKSQDVALPALGAEPGATSVSGLSAGAYMAGQFQIAHSSIVVGAGIIAGGPYGCAESAFADVMPGPGAPFMNLSKAINGCMLDAMQMGHPQPGEARRARAQARRGGPHRPHRRHGADRVYLFSGTNDRVVLPSIVAAAAKLYSALGVPEPQVKLVSDIGAGHAFVTDGQGPRLRPHRRALHHRLRLRPGGRSCWPTSMASSSRARRSRPASSSSSTSRSSSATWPGMASPTRRRLRAAVLPRRARAAACTSSSMAAISSAPRSGTLHQGYGLCRLGRCQPSDRAVSRRSPPARQPAGLLGLVGLYGPRLLTRKGPQVVAVRRMLERLSGHATLSRS